MESCFTRMAWQVNGYYLTCQEETPFEDSFGYFAAVGRASSAGLNYLERHKLPPPYSDCTSSGDGVLNYYPYYEVEACLRSCLQDAIMAQCRCYDPQFRHPASTSLPSCYNTTDPNQASE